MPGVEQLFEKEPSAEERIEAGEEIIEEIDGGWHPNCDGH